MKQKYIYMFLAALSATISCVQLDESDLVKDVEEAERVKFKFSATIEQSGKTKTSLEGSLSDAVMRTVWTPSDNIGVAGIRQSMSANEPVIEFVTDIEENSENAEFEGAITMAPEYQAFYPYQSSLRDSTGIFIFDLPGNQKYTAGSFDPKAAPMVAKAAYGEAFDFQNLCGLLAVKIKGEETVKGITFIGKDETGNVMPVSGRYSVDMNKFGEDDFPQIKCVKSNTSVSLSMETAVQLNGEAIPFYFVLPPATYSSFMLLIYTESGQVLVKEGKSPLTVGRSHIKPTAALNFVEATVSVDLSEIGTSNCYIVPDQKGMYSFDATIIGNGEYGIVQNAEFHTQDAEIRPSYMEVLWTDRPDLIYGLSLINDEAKFYATGKEGNALVAAKDHNGTILWSWHLWITDQPEEQTYRSRTASYVMLDRNIGATRADMGSGDEWLESVGTMYQWGRKDPFVKNEYRKMWSPFESIEEAIQRPDYYSCNSSTWLNNFNNKSWKSDQKTIYDPCPVGYRVAVSGVYNDLYAMNLHDNGQYFLYDGEGEAWYPYTPYINNNADYCAHENYGALWTVTKNNEYNVFRYDADNHELNSYWISDGRQVRCMKDDKHVDISYPRVNVISFTDITEEGVTVLADVRDEGVSAVTERGIIWGSDADLTIDSENKMVVGEGGGEYECTITGLSHSTRYYVKAYAISERGIGYSEVASFATVYLGSSMDLSTEGTANCYIVPPVYSTYSFDAGVKGNSTEPIGIGASAEILWETDKTGQKAMPGTVLSNARYVSGRVYFETSDSEQEGNALIAVKDANGTILWSWHIWVTDVPANHVYKNKYCTFSVQDRNLGATRGDKGIGEEWKESFGLYYLWGRKDPFVGGAMTTVDREYSVEESIQNPTVKTSLSKPDEDKLWSTEAKTMYDPCPEGYRLPPYGVWDFLKFSNVEGDTYDHGWNILYNNFAYAWYPGRLYPETWGSSYYDEGYILTAEYNRTLCVTSYSIHESGTNDGSVRCIKEDGHADLSFPTVEIGSIGEISSSSASVTVSVTDPGVYPISERGIIIGDHPDIVIENSRKITDSGIGGGEFTININDLEHSTRYYVRAYAIDTHGAWYSKDLTFYTPYEGGAVDLSRNGTANCYIVPPVYSTYTFDCTVKGNSMISVGTPAEAVVLWETRNDRNTINAGDVIESISLEGNKVKFMLPFEPKPGNALVAVKDAFGTILWSWHIWVVDFDPVQTGNMYISGNMMMDRNLGALNATPGDAGSLGLYYQWGRKDPFIGSGNRNREFAYTAPENAITYVDYSSINDNLDYSVQNPTVQMNASSWNDDRSYWNTQKTEYDPCPQGWKVADPAVWDGIKRDSGYSGNYVIKVSEPYSIPAAYYPTTGRVPGYREIDWIYDYVCIWTDRNSQKMEWSYHNNNSDYYTSSDRCDYMMAVRCMKDADYSVTTSGYDDLTATSVKVSGNIEINDMTRIEEMGFIYLEGGAMNPSILTNTGIVKIETLPSGGNFTGTITGLKPETPYYVRAYAKGGNNTKYGDNVWFTTGSEGSGEGFDNGGDYEWE